MFGAFTQSFVFKYPFNLYFVKLMQKVNAGHLIQLFGNSIWVVSMYRIGLRFLYYNNNNNNNILLLLRTPYMYFFYKHLVLNLCLHTY